VLEMGVDLTPEDHEAVHWWRKGARASLRTTVDVTYGAQELWYENLDRNLHRYWGFFEQENKEAYLDGESSTCAKMVAFGGLTYIDWVNRSAEISLIVNPSVRGKGHGKDAVILLVSEAFDRMNLDQVYGEAYRNTSAWKFWEVMAERYDAVTTKIPRRKYWDREYYDSFYFSIRNQS
jgi:RimJ/RimL family protein N-acetyltransferase